MTPTTISRIPRRTLLQGGLAAPLMRLNQATPVPTPSLNGTTLRVLMARHPLSSYDEAIRALAGNWSMQQGVIVDLDLVPADEIPAAFAREVELGVGHDLIGTNMPMLDHAGLLSDLSDLFTRAEEQFGPASDASDAATRLPDGSRPSFSIAWGPAPLIYRRSVWEAYGLPDGPSTWEQLLETGAQIWNEEGMNVGFGLSPEPGSERFAGMLLSAFGASMLDASGEIAIDSPEAVEAVHFASELYNAAMSPESFDWQTDRPARLLGDGIASIISDDVSALRLAQARNMETANDLFLAPPPGGPAGNVFPSSMATSYRAFHIPTYAANQNAAEAFILMLVESSEALVGSAQLADRPAYGSLVPGLVQAGGWLDSDPYGAQPANKLSLLKSATGWTTWPGAPGPASALATRAHGEFLLARMMASTARGDLTPEEAVEDAATTLDELRSALEEEAS